MATWGEYYHSIAAQTALYRETNRRLAERADLRPGMTVVDLGCGSGLTALAALDQVPEGLKLYLIDASESMIEEAKRRVGDRGAVFQVADAAEAPGLLPERVDRVLCNLSLLHFRDPEGVLRAWRSQIKPAGRLCFTLPGTYFNTGGGVVTPQWALLQALHQRGLVSRAPNPPERLMNQRSMEGTLMGAGFKPFHYEVIGLDPEGPETEPGGELYRLMQLHPALGGDSHREAVERTHAILPEVAGEVAAMKPAWRAVLFMAQPAISPEEALQIRLAKKS